MAVLARTLIAAVLFCALLQASLPAVAETRPEPAPSAEGVIRLKSAHTVAETVKRLKAAVEAKGIRFFDAIDQSALADGAKLKLGASTLVLFGNPPLGVQFLQSNRYAGLDWPVRMLVTEEADGSVWLAWTDFAFIGRRYAIKDKGQQLEMATKVAATLATEAAAR